jgi:2-polyprenyl-3-methyl-5-hydroxy-6-metoxy-1,4-benzoquinol methylase
LQRQAPRDLAGKALRRYKAGVTASEPVNVETLNDRLAREHSIDDYYARSPLPIRLIENRRLQIIRDMVGPCRGLSLAEIGSGGGHVLRMFRDAKLTAIDVSDVFLATAKKNLAGYDCRFVKGEVDKLDLPAESFDRIVCTEVLEHTVDPEAILRTIARLLSKAGVAVITVPNDPLILRIKSVVRKTPVGWVLGARVNWGGDEYHLHRWTPDEFRRVLERQFRVTDYEASPHKALPIRACFRCEPL